MRVHRERDRGDGRRTLVHVEGIEDPIVACDGGILASMLSNLLRNAIKFMAARPERRVVVTIACCRGRVPVEDVR